IHSAKGQEWKSVFVLNVVDGVHALRSGSRNECRTGRGTPPALRGDDAGKGRFASRRSPAILCTRPTFEGRPPRVCVAKRFIPESLLKLFEKTTWPTVSAAQSSSAAARTPQIDIQARMRGMWR